MVNMNNMPCYDMPFQQKLLLALPLNASKAIQKAFYQPNAKKRKLLNTTHTVATSN
jgi:hypothetical protein